MRATASFMLHRSNMPPDPLSDILSLLRPRSVACGAINAGDGCIAFPASRGIKVHALTAGEAWLAVEHVANPLHLSAGDCLILPHGRSYRIASDLSLPVTDYRNVLGGCSPGHVMSWNGGGRATIVSAAFAICEQHADLLPEMLPAVAHVHGASERSALHRSLQQMMQELRNPRPGGRLIVEHLATTLLAQALRAYLACATGERVGGLFALADKQIGSAISAMHADPARRWTVQALAEHTGMSRTGFAVRFRNTVSRQ